MNDFFKLFLSYVFMEIATLAGKYNIPSMLYFAIGISYWIFVIKFPIYKKSMEDVNGKKL